MEYDNTIEITYTVFGFDEAGETTFEMDVSDSVFNKLQDAEDEGETLDSDYVSENFERIHKMILKAIRENMEEESLDPDDGKVEKMTSWGYKYKEDCPATSHSDMNILADDDDIDYSISLY